MMRYIKWFGLIGLCALFALAGCKKAKKNKDGDAGQAYEDFAETPNPGAVLEIPEFSEEDYPVYVAQDHIVLVTEESLSVEEAMDVVADVARAVGGEKVGQIPDYRLYQLRVDGDTQAKLEAALETARDIEGIESAAYNVMATFFAPICLPMDDDAGTLDRDHRKAYSAIEYYKALALWEEIDPYVTLSHVRVGVMDTGLSLEGGNFDDITLHNGLDAEEPIVETDEGAHGTKVSSIIGADNWDGCVGGIASRFLGEKLKLGVYTVGGIFDSFLSCRTALGNGEKILNVSAGYNTLGVSHLAEMWADLMADHTDALMVAAAPNQNVEINAQDRNAPGTVSSPNIITVGGITKDDWSVKRENSAYGLAVEIAAPSDNLVTFYGSSTLFDVTIDGCYEATGNSFAAPQVTAVAAVLKGIDAGLTGAELKHAILYNAGPTKARFGSAVAMVPGLRLLLSKPLMQVLIDKSDTPAAVLDLIDSNRDGEEDNIALVLQRICANASYDVQGYSSLNFEGVEEDALFYSAEISPPLYGTHWDFTLGMGEHDLDEEPMEQLRITTAAEALSIVYDHAFPLAEEPSIYNILMDSGDDAVVDFGSFSGGSLTFTRCDILERGLLFHPSLNDQQQIMFPVNVLLEGYFDGTAEIWEISECGGGCLAPEPHAVSGSFVVNTSLLDVLIDEELIDSFEFWCNGGLEQTTL